MCNQKMFKQILSKEVKRLFRLALSGDLQHNIVISFSLKNPDNEAVCLSNRDVNLIVIPFSSKLGNIFQNSS